MPGNFPVTAALAAILALAAGTPAAGAPADAVAGPAPDAVSARGPDAPPARPRIALEAEVRDAAAREGFPLGPGEAAVYPVLLDADTLYSLTRPVAQGPDSLRVLIRDASGDIKSAVLPRARVRLILDPGGRAIRWEETGTLLTLALLFPLAYPAFNPMLALPEFWAATSALLAAPRYQAHAPEDFLAGPRLAGSLALSLTAAPRSLFFPEDPRFEPVGGIQAEFEARTRPSPVSVSILMRALKADRPLRKNPAAFQAAPTAYFGNHTAGRIDSAYAAMGTALTVTPAMRVLWIDAPRFALFSRFGLLIGESHAPADGWVGGPEMSLGCEAWPDAHWGLRAEAAWISPRQRDWEEAEAPAASLGLAYRFAPAEVPSYQPAMEVALLAAPRETGTPWVSLQILRGIGPYQDAGLEAGFAKTVSRSYSSYPPSDYYSGSSTETRSEDRRISLDLVYSAHSDRARRAWIGGWAGVGLLAVASFNESRNISGGSISTYADGNDSHSMTLSLGPEAGLRLAGPLGLRGRWRIAGTDATGLRDPYAFSAGLEYAFPARGLRR